MKKNIHNQCIHHSSSEEVKKQLENLDYKKSLHPNNFDGILSNLSAL